MKVTEIEAQQKAKNRVNVYVDGKFAFGLNEKLLVDYDLYIGRELTKEDIEKIKAGDSFSKCLDKAFRFLSYRMRSEKEMYDKLTEKFDEPMVKKAIKKLKDFNLINDKEFAKAWVNSRKSSRSGRALRFEMIKKGINKEIIEISLEDLDGQQEYKAALAMVQKKSKYQNLERQEAYQKIGGFLARKGYSYDIIKKVISDLRK